jgi:hypothetical protein
MQVVVKPSIEARFVKAKDMEIGQIGYIRSKCSHNGTLVLRGYQSINGLNKPRNTWTFDSGLIPPSFNIELLPVGSVVELTVEE